jgi:hypothetical protein
MLDRESREIAEEALYCRVYQIACARESGASESAAKDAIFRYFQERYKYRSAPSAGILIVSRRASAIARKCAFGPMTVDAGSFSYCSMQATPALSGLELSLRKYDVIARHLRARSRDPEESQRLEGINELIYERYLENGGRIPEREIRIVSEAIERHFRTGAPPPRIDAAYFEREIIAKMLKHMMAGKGLSLDDLAFMRKTYPDRAGGGSLVRPSFDDPSLAVRDIYLALGRRGGDRPPGKENGEPLDPSEKKSFVLRRGLSAPDRERLTDILSRIGYFRPARFSSLAYATIDTATANYCNPLRRQKEHKRCERIASPARPARETMAPGMRGEIDAAIGKEWNYLCSVIEKVSRYEYLLGCGVKESLAAVTAAAVAKYASPGAPSYAEVGREMRWPEKRVREMIVNVNRLLQQEILRKRKDIPPGLARYVTINRIRKAGDREKSA